MRLTDELDRVILAAVNDDFATLEFIADTLHSRRGGIAGKLDTENLHRRLFGLIGDKLINAYLLHAEPPYITPLAIDREDTLATCWFYITQRGRKCLVNSGRKRSTQIRSHKVDPPGRASYTPAVNF